MSVAIFTFGRFNPPTNGHGVLADKIKSVAKRSSGKPFIFTGHSKDAKKNPLDYKSKIKYMSKAFRGVDVVNDASIRTIFDALKYLDKKNYEEVKLIVGSDRVPEFRKLLKKYLKDYGFTKFEVVSAGERDPDAEGVKGMSASKMRAAVARNDYDSFLLGCPKGLSKKDCLQMFNDVKKGMGVSESINEELWFNHEEFEQFCERTMSLVARKKMARVARRTAKKRARTRKRKEKFRKSDDKLKTLAKKQAKMKLRQKMLGDKHWGDLSIGARQKIDDMLQKKSGKIKNMAKKLYPAVKKQERERLQSIRNPGPSDQKEGKQILREPEIYDRLVSQLKAKGKDNDAAHAIATSQLQKHGILKKGTRELTDKGRERNSMSASERAKDRAAKKDGKSPNDYKYNKKTNIATQKEELMKEHSEEKPLLKWMEVFRSELKKSGSSYKKVEPTDALKLYYKGVDPKKAASQLKESVELDEAWTADSVIKNAEIGSKKGYGINIVKTGGITKTPYKYMIMTNRPGKNIRVTFDFGKNEFEGTAKSVALYLNKLLGIKESVELSEFVPKSMDAKAALSVYDKLKKGSKVAVEYNSMIGGSGSSTGKPFELVVSSPHRVVGKSKVGRIILKNPKNMGGAKYTLYNRNGKISLAHGDMGTILKDLKIIKESVELDEGLPSYSYPTFKEIQSKGKKLGDWMGKSYFEYDGSVWMLKNGRASNQGPVAQAKKKFNKSLLKNLKFESVEVDEACWDTHVQKGMKKKGGKMVPNCVPKGVTDAVETPTTKHATDDSSWRKYKGSNSKQKSFEEDTFKKKAVRDVEAKFKPQTDALKKKLEIAKKKRDSIKVTSIDTSARDAARKKKEEADKKLAAIRAKLAAARANSIRGRSQNTSKPSDVEENHASLKDRRAYLKKTVADRTARVLARREMIKNGKAKVGDGKDVDHKDGNPQNNSKRNLRIMDVNTNRSRNNNEEHGAGDEGTDKLLKKYRKDTPYSQGTED